MLLNLIPYPRFEIDSHSSSYQQLENFCVKYLNTMLHNIMHMNIPPALEKNGRSLTLLQKKLLSKDRRIRNLVKFHIKTKFYNFKFTRRKRSNSEFITSELSLTNSLLMMAPLVEKMLKINQKFEAAYSGRLQTIGQSLNVLAHRSDDLYADIPITPFNLCSIFLSSVDSISFTVQELHDSLLLLEDLLDQQLADFYTQIELCCNTLGQDKKTDNAIDVELNSNATKREGNHNSDNILSSKAIAKNNGDEAIVEFINNKNTTYSGQLSAIIDVFEQETKNGVRNHFQSITEFTRKISPFIDAQQQDSYRRYVQFSYLISRQSKVSNTLKLQYSRISAPMIRLALDDPDFLNTEDHPVSSFLESVLEYEKDCNHSDRFLSYIAKLIDHSFSTKNKEFNYNASSFETFIKKYKHFRCKEYLASTIRDLSNEIRDDQKYILLVQLIEKFTEDLILDDELMSFFFSHWLKWLKYLLQNYGAQTPEFKQSAWTMKYLAGIINTESTQSYCPSIFTLKYKMVDDALMTMGCSDSYRERIQQQFNQALSNRI